jgi:hypothetical protein
MSEHELNAEQADSDYDWTLDDNNNSERDSDDDPGQDEDDLNQEDEETCKQAARDFEAWEEELDECTDNVTLQTKTWPEIRAEVDKQLKTQFKTLARTEVNQLIILRSFATLLMRGVKRIDASLRVAEQWRDGAGTHFARRVRALARHYQLLGKLLTENRGGARSGGRCRGTSLLLDERVEY